MTDGQIISSIDIRSKATEKRLATLFKQTMKNVKSEMSKYYEKFADDKGVMTYAEMAKYNRLVKFNLFLDEEMKELGINVDKEIKTLCKDVYNESFLEYSINIQDQYSGSISFSQVRIDDIRSLINEPNVSGLSLAETLTRSRYKALLDERAAIQQGLLQGESYVKLAKRIQESFNKSFNDSLRIARTEAGRAQSEGQFRAYSEAEDMGIVLIKTWTARHKNTRNTHLALDGKQPDGNGYWHSSGGKALYPHGFGIASEDINCHCIVMAKVKNG